jgi:hypothetical protein
LWPTVISDVGSILVIMLVKHVPYLRHLLPEPFNLFDHAGNFGGGALVALAAVYLKRGLEVRKSGRAYLTRAQLRSFYRRWVPGVLVVTAAVNAVTETRWGVDTLWVAKALFGAKTTPDVLDLIYSVGAGGVLAVLGWRTATSGGPVALGGSSRPNTGQVIEGEFGDGEQPRFEELLAKLAKHGKLRRRKHGPAQARAPTAVLEIPLTRAVRRLLRGAGLADLAGRPFAFYWTERDQVLVFAPMPTWLLAAVEGTDPGTPAGGPLAVGDLTVRVVRRVLRALPRLASRMRVVSRWELPSLPRGPPGAPLLMVLEADAATVRMLRRAGVVDPARRLIAFGWVHPEHAPYGVIVMLRHVLEELHGLVESGRLDPGWFEDLIAYETRFRIEGHTHSEGGRSCAVVARDLIERLERARRAGASPTVEQLRRFTDLGLGGAALLRYLIPRDRTRRCAATSGGAPRWCARW